MKKFLPLIVIVLLVGAVAFFGGMKYGQSKVASNGGQGNFRNLSPEQRQQMTQQLGNGAVGRSGNNSATGDIISKDDQSITVKLSNGGSKIVFYSNTTTIDKFAQGTAGDLEVGKTVSVSGTANQDGSVTAKSIQIRPEVPKQL